MTDKSEIIFYGDPNCADSRQVKMILLQNGVAYQWVDITRDAEGHAFVEKINDGVLSVPTLSFPDGTVLVEPSISEIGSHESRPCMEENTSPPLIYKFFVLVQQFIFSDIIIHGEKGNWSKLKRRFFKLFWVHIIKSTYMVPDNLLAYQSRDCLCSLLLLHQKRHVDHDRKV